MKVFVNKARGGYCGGLVVVAANSPEEAHGALMSRYNNDPAKNGIIVIMKIFINLKIGLFLIMFKQMLIYLKF